MVINLILIQIISYGIRIAEHVNIPIFSEIYRDEGRLQLCIALRKAYTLPHIKYNIPLILPETCKFRKMIFSFLIKRDHFSKQSGSCRPLPELFKIIGHTA